MLLYLTNHVACRQPKTAGVYLMSTMGELAPHSKTYMEVACSYNEPFPIHPFAFRTHAHGHGKCDKAITGSPELINVDLAILEV